MGQASRGVSGADDVEKTRKPRGSLQFMAIEHDLYFISMAARLLDMHPQTLRKYERLGLVSPTRTVGSMRVYSQEELERLRLIKRPRGPEDSHSGL